MIGNPWSSRTSCRRRCQPRLLAAHTLPLAALCGNTHCQTRPPPTAGGPQERCVDGKKDDGSACMCPQDSCIACIISDKARRCLMHPICHASVTLRMFVTWSGFSRAAWKPNPLHDSLACWCLCRHPHAQRVLATLLWLAAAA